MIHTPLSKTLLARCLGAVAVALALGLSACSLQPSSGMTREQIGRAHV